MSSVWRRFKFRIVQNWLSNAHVEIIKNTIVITNHNSLLMLYPVKKSDGKNL